MHPKEHLDKPLYRLPGTFFTRYMYRYAWMFLKQLKLLWFKHSPVWIITSQRWNTCNFKLVSVGILVFSICLSSGLGQWCHKCLDYSASFHCFSKQTRKTKDVRTQMERATESRPRETPTLGAGEEGTESEEQTCTGTETARNGGVMELRLQQAILGGILSATSWNLQPGCEIDIRIGSCKLGIEVDADLCSKQKDSLGKTRGHHSWHNLEFSTC